MTDSRPAPPPLLGVRGLAKNFEIRRGLFARTSLRAVSGIDLELKAGEACGLVGESGSGKSTVARLILRLLEPTSGEIRFDGHDITSLAARDLRQWRRRMQIIFQDPHSSLNPRKTIFKCVAEPLVIHDRMRGTPLRRRVEELLEVVGLGRDFMYRYPHELSGGQKQRVCIARAVALDPKLLILDEPTSALDVSVQAQILEFLKDLQLRLGLTYLFISHNLAVVRHVCDRVAVMYLGQIVEQGTTQAVFDRPMHPYTQALLAAVPLPQAVQDGGAIPLEGDIPSPINVPTGCPFHTRCPRRIGPACSQRTPPLLDVGEGRAVACHIYDPAVGEQTGAGSANPSEIEATNAPN